jgi:hypothetical protein
MLYTRFLFFSLAKLTDYMCFLKLYFETGFGFLWGTVYLVAYGFLFACGYFRLAFGGYAVVSAVQCAVVVYGYLDIFLKL